MLLGVPHSQRRWSGYRGNDAVLSLRLTCLNCSHTTYEVEITVLADFDKYRSFLEEADVCPNCGVGGTRVVSYVFEGRAPRMTLYPEPMFLP